MKFYAFAIAAVAMMGAAIAQTVDAPAPPAAPATPTEEFLACPPLPPDPVGFPDGLTAKAKDMEAAQSRYNAWETAVGPVLQCRRNAQQKVKAAAEATTAAFNADAIRVNTVRGAWKTEAEEYMARQAAAASQKKR